MWKTSFPWHTEDMELYSVNYIHFGASKIWYAVPPEYGRRLEEFAGLHFPEEKRQCPHFLRHKTTMISPETLIANNIPCNKVHYSSKCQSKIRINYYI